MGRSVKGLMGNLGVGVEVQVKADSSAAKSTIARRVAGRVRRDEVRELWVQDCVAKGQLQIVKMKGERGPRVEEARVQAESGAVREGARHGPAES